jgi:hypothetical protein
MQRGSPLASQIRAPTRSVTRHQIPFRYYSWSNARYTQTKADDKDTAPSSDPAAFRARLKHRAPAPGTSATPTYSRVLDTAQQLAELERLRAQDAAYIRLLEQGRATLVRDAHAEARSRAATPAPTTTTPTAAQDEQRKRAEEAERAMKAERERAEKAETRVRALEQALSAAKARAAELEREVERERRRREEWESGLEQLAMGVTGPSAAAARL